MSPSPADLTILALSEQYVKVPVRAVVDGAPYDPTGDPVELAIVPHGTEPAGGDWHAGSWETTVTGLFSARVLVGPSSGLVLAAGYYTVFVKITGSPEIPVLESGTLRVK
jgi:hypothetical protein